MISQKYGVRATQNLNLLDEVYAEEPAVAEVPDKPVSDDGALYDAIFR